MSGPSIQAERQRLQEARENGIPWRKWGPYLSERQWGTVREDYSPHGDAWNYFSHDQARSRAYHWGEDGLAGISDDKQLLCFALALWNGKDPILKERLFGLTNSEGNHGEDVKEYYFYLDSTPTHSYMKYLYKYPQREYPYLDLIQKNRERSRYELEYELLDTGIFDDDHYFDVFVEYAKQTPDDILIQITVANRGPEDSVLHVLPTLWFRNTWSWWDISSKPLLEQVASTDDQLEIVAHHSRLGDRTLFLDRNVPILFAENETNNERIFHRSNETRFVKDGINDYVVSGKTSAVNPEQRGTKCSVHYQLEVPAHGTEVIKLRLCPSFSPDSQTVPAAQFFKNDFSKLLRSRQKEADEFYDSIVPAGLNPDSAMVMRQALAGMLWTKQHYFFDLQLWLREHDAAPGSSFGKVRNQQWFHMLNEQIISMPDKWEYPWYAAWDLAFHTVALAMVDMDFAKQQLEMMLNTFYMHPSGQIPAYEWNFGDVNPPVHAWATLYLYNLEKEINGEADREFLKRSFDRLMFNFSWWVNRKDPTGRNVFEGGFLGLDNIGVFDRSAQLPAGGSLEQADGTAWMVFYCQNMLEIALELSRDDLSYQAVATKFGEHYLWIASAMDRIGEHADELWDGHDGFFYDLLRTPHGGAQRLKVRSMVGLLPLCAATVIFPRFSAHTPEFVENIREFLRRNAGITTNIASPSKPGYKGRYLLSVLNEDKLRRILGYMLDEKEFLSDFGIRSLSRYHLEHPYFFHIEGQNFQVNYEAAESTSGTFGGNSNWRGPIWFPVNMLILRGLLAYYLYYGDDFKIECPTGSGKLMTLLEVAQEISQRLCRIFLRDPKTGHRPVFGLAGKFQNDPHWKDYPLFYEYFHGDNGAGIGASHQTGWTGLVARLLQLSVGLDAQALLNTEQRPMLTYRPAEKEVLAGD